MSPEKDIALATLDHVIQEAENDINNGNASDEVNSIIHNDVHALTALDSVIKEAEDELESSIENDYESKVESDLEEAKDETIMEDAASEDDSSEEVQVVKNDLKIIDLEVETDVDEETALEGRAGDLNHVFLNLVDNAARAVGDRGRVRIRGRVEGGRYRITVEDSGPGIEPSVLPRLFDPFVTSRPAGEGTGLGLSIAREIVSAHGGTIDADASPTLGGARFTVVLPLPEGSPRPSPGNTPSASAPRL